MMQRIKSLSGIEHECLRHKEKSYRIRWLATKAPA
jgi:hypothetical protein